MALIWRAKAQIEQYVNRYVKLYVMYVLALSNYKQPAAAAGYKPAPQLGKQIAVYHTKSLYVFKTFDLSFMFHFYVSTY